MKEDIRFKCKDNLLTFSAANCKLNRVINEDWNIIWAKKYPAVSITIFFNNFNYYIIYKAPHT